MKLSEATWFAWLTEAQVRKALANALAFMSEHILCPSDELGVCPRDAEGPCVAQSEEKYADCWLRFFNEREEGTLND